MINDQETKARNQLQLEMFQQFNMKGDRDRSDSIGHVTGLDCQSEQLRSGVFKDGGSSHPGPDAHGHNAVRPAGNTRGRQ